MRTTADRRTVNTLDRRSAATRRDDEIRRLRVTYGLSREQIEDLIEQHGTRSARLEAAVRKLAD
jgi:hypothetical protein